MENCAQTFQGEKFQILHNTDLEDRRPIKQFDRYDR